MKTHPANYGVVAPQYDRRYERIRFDGIEAVLRRFIGEAEPIDVVEVLEADLRLYATVGWKPSSDRVTGNGIPPSR